MSVLSRVEPGTANAYIYRKNLSGQREPVPFPIASGVVVKTGQMVRMLGGASPTATNTIKIMSSGADTQTALAGIAIDSHGTTDGAGSILVDVSPNSIYEMKAAANANGWAIGQPLEFASAGGATKTAAAASKNDLLVVAENNTSTAATTVMVKMRPGKSFLDLCVDA